jgi:voltage-gated potassium channel
MVWCVRESGVRQTRGCTPLLIASNNGHVEVVSSDGKTVFATLSPGGYFGETALLMNQPRNACVRAVDYVDLYTLNRTTLGEILEKFPSFQKHLHEIAAERQAGNKK